MEAWVGRKDLQGSDTEGRMVRQARFRFRQDGSERSVGSLSMEMPAAPRSLRRNGAGSLRRGFPSRAVVDVVVSDAGGSLEQGATALARRSSFAVGVRSCKSELRLASGQATFLPPLLDVHEDFVVEIGLDAGNVPAAMSRYGSIAAAATAASAFSDDVQALPWIWCSAGSSLTPAVGARAEGTSVFCRIPMDVIITQNTSAMNGLISVQMQLIKVGVDSVCTSSS